MKNYAKETKELKQLTVKDENIRNLQNISS